MFLFKQNYSFNGIIYKESLHCHPIFSFLNLPTKISPEKVHAISAVPPTSPSCDTSPGDTSTQLLVTNFLSFNPPQYKSNHHKQDLLSPQARFFVTCTNFKLQSHKISPYIRLPLQMPHTHAPHFQSKFSIFNSLREI